MKSVGVRELRQNLSVYLRAIQGQGEPTEVTDRGHPVAVLAPLDPTEDEYAALEAAGRLPAATEAWDSFDAPAGPITSGGTDGLDELRGERLRASAVWMPPQS